MAETNQILKAVKLKIPLKDATIVNDDVLAIVGKYLRPSLFTNTEDTIKKMKNELVKAYTSSLRPIARESGLKAANIILDAIEPDKPKASVTKSFGIYSKRNLDVLKAEISRDVANLSSEIELAFLEAKRDGVARKVLIDELAQSYQEELASLRKKDKAVREAASNLAKAELSGDLRKVKPARAALSKAKSNAQSTRGVYDRLAVKVQGNLRDAVRREAEEAQYSAFRNEGYKEFIWIAVNGTDACPSCEALHGTIKSESKWSGIKPGSGNTYCGTACMCILAPSEVTDNNPALAKPLVVTSSGDLFPLTNRKP